VFVGLPVGLVAPEQQAVLTKRGHHRQLVKGHALPPSCHNPRPSGLGESQRADFHARQVELAFVVGHGANNDNNLSTRGLALPIHLGHVLGDFGNRERGPVHLAHKQAVEDNLVEV
jgi:hypothetical protein